MSTEKIEDAVISAARAKGFQINSAVMQTVAIDLAGSSLNGGMILILGRGTLSISDYLRDLHNRAPSGFAELSQADKADDELTVSQMRQKNTTATSVSIPTDLPASPRATLPN
ncbi:hypothetical protein ACVWZ6_009199 [Bradyrhizobium sp. GM6.1]